jgi:hypothetical protein
VLRNPGDSCKLDLVQRKAGATPLGLLRLAGTTVRQLCLGLHARFVGLDDPVQIVIENGQSE